MQLICRLPMASSFPHLEIHIRSSALKDIIITILVFRNMDESMKKEESKSISIEDRQIYKRNSPVHSPGS